MTMATLSYKAYLLDEDKIWEPTETRRFGIDADVAMNFVYLREKLQSIFPDLQGKKFTVTWKDDEDESITISTNEELEIALEEMAKNNIYKLYIIKKSMHHGDQLDPPNIEKILHPGVICDGCEKDIRGFRFKCMQCPDYDLCNECMTLGKHYDHYLIRMTHPVDWSSRDSRRLAHNMRKFVKKVQHNKDDERRCPHRSSKRGSCPMFNATSDESHEQKRSKEQHREPSAEAATEATEDPQEATRHSFSQLLKIVEDNLSNISQFLDPLGINVTVMTDKDSTRNKPTGIKTSTQKPENGASSSEDSAKKFPGEGKKLNSETPSTTGEKTVPSTNTDATSAQKEPTTTCAEQAAEAEEWTIVQPQNEISRTPSTSSSLNEATSKQITPSAPAATAAEPDQQNHQTEPPKQNIYPSLPKEVKNEFYHPNPKIQEAVTAMMAMGFSNEGGWLTHLLVSKDGDIGKALDVLHPVRHH
ncbi:sequestosome-1 isoform X2 [Cataglyphis hispanica]|uniref:sequestosome-1 isoform X2 n=1 Tax=Cataglyphis hispanica TaxID=1086592 RepID=UPI0021809578|nr:sequestosome-1 isoform X2 [Cataglyphis hispanica]